MQISFLLSRSQFLLHYCPDFYPNSCSDTAAIPRYCRYYKQRITVYLRSALNDDSLLLDSFKRRLKYIDAHQRPSPTSSTLGVISMTGCALANDLSQFSGRRRQCLEMSYRCISRPYHHCLSSAVDRSVVSSDVASRDSTLMSCLRSDTVITDASIFLVTYLLIYLHFPQIIPTIVFQSYIDYPCTDFSYPVRSLVVCFNFYRLV